MTKRDLFIQIAAKLTEAVKKKLKENNSLASGDLVTNITPKFTEDSVSLDMLDYAEYVDGGTRPHMPPVDPIKKWVQQKGLNISPWAIAINIKKYGTKAHPFLYVLDDVDVSSLIEDYTLTKIEELEFEDKKIVLNI